MTKDKGVKNNRRSGAATVEAIIAFSGFLFVIFTILNIVNFCRVQTLISNAMATVTKELTQYAYFYEITGLHKYDQSIQAIGAEGGANLNTVASSVGDLYNAFGTAADATEEEMTGLTNSLMEGSFSSDNVNDLMKTVEMNGVNIETAIQNMDAQLSGVVDKPVLYMKSIIAVAGSEGLETAKSRVLATPLAKALLKKHFGGSEADETLKSLGVVNGLSGMNFNLSTIFTKEHPDEIHLVVYYKLNVSQLFDWADFEATLCKETRARAWLGGDAVVERVTAASASTPGGGGSPVIPEETPPEEPPADSTPTEDTPTEDNPAGDRTLDEDMLAMGAGGLVILQNDYDELSADENLEALKAIVEYLNSHIKASEIRKVKNERI